MGEILIPRRTKVEKGYELLADITVGTATTSVDISGLNIGKGDEVVLVSEYKSVDGENLRFKVNSSTPQYAFQEIGGSGTTVGALRSDNNTQIIPGMGAGITSFSIANIKVTNSGYAIVQSRCIGSISSPSNIIIDETAITSKITFTTITSLTLYSYVANSIGIGSRFQLYKIGGA